ncbi:alpha-amylase family glycosyl hydrolase [Williamsia sterculiae]|uniref:Cyclomaltodextrinase n=1 Tax=Williamsia sterculiae TaxID=1344003 RepID=A0A1N7FKQ2_9NOCA|nr:cyclomaltodextrinase [Williamsia sterculiae]
MGREWIDHAIWWQIYPLGFTGVDIRGDRDGAVGDLRALIGWLDYAAELGVSGLLLGPIFTSATHGYDTIDHFHVDPRLGGDAAFDELVGACRDRGLHIILDGVFNHVSDQSELFARAQTDPDARGWFVEQDPAREGRSGGPAFRTFEGHTDLIALNHQNPAVIGHVSTVMMHWLGRGADGWRLDAAYLVPDHFWRSVLEPVRREFPDAYVFGEVIHGDYAAFVEASGVDSVTQYELWKATWSSLNDQNLFELSWAISRHDEFTRAFVPQTFVGNHDVTRLASVLTDDRDVAIAYALLFCLAGLPSVYYGDEQRFRGEKTERLGGDDAVRPAFPSSPDELAPYGWDTYRELQQLIGFRRRHPWLHRATTETVDVTNTTMRLISRSDDTEITLYLNVGDDPHGCGVAAAEVTLASDDVPRDDDLVLPPHSWAIIG